MFYLSFFYHQIYATNIGKTFKILNKMVSANNEVLGGGFGGGVGGGYGYGGCGFGGGGYGILGLIALLSLFRNNFGRGDYEGAGKCCCEMQEGIGHIRHDIGEQKYDMMQGILTQLGTQLSAINSGRIENIQAVLSQTNALQAEMFGLRNNILQSENNINTNVLKGNFDLSRQLDFNRAEAAKCCCETQKEVLAMGYKNELANCQQTNQLSNQISACCCANELASQKALYESQLSNCVQTNTLQKAIDDCCCTTNQNIERTAFATQLRDLECCCKTDKQIAELACGQKEIIAFIANQNKDNKLECLQKELREAERRIERMTDERIAARTNCLINELGNSNKQQFGPTYNWVNPACPSGCGC